MHDVVTMRALARVVQTLDSWTAVFGTSLLTARARLLCLDEQSLGPTGGSFELNASKRYERLKMSLRGHPGQGCQVWSRSGG
jgi:hypothetical protein